MLLAGILMLVISEYLFKKENRDWANGAKMNSALLTASAITGAVGILLFLSAIAAISDPWPFVQYLYKFAPVDPNGMPAGIFWHLQFWGSIIMLVGVFYSLAAADGSKYELEKIGCRFALTVGTGVAVIFLSFLPCHSGVVPLIIASAIEIGAIRVAHRMSAAIKSNSND